MKRLLPLLLLLLLAGCDVLQTINLPWPRAAAPTSVARETTATQAQTPAPGQTAASTPRSITETPPPAPVLTLWVPPEFDPAGGTPAGDLLRARLEEFTRQYSGARVEVRVKAASGPGGLLESLTAASAAAPSALPSVIALPRPDLEVAAIKGLVMPLDGLSSAIDQQDWYDYARQLAMVQGATFSLPFAGDALVIAYRPANVTAPPSDINAIYRLGQPLAFPAGDPQAMFVLALYRSLGGEVEDAQRRPALQADLLSQALTVLADGEQRGIFPNWLSQYETGGQVWQAFIDRRVNALVTWSNNYLSGKPDDTAITALPALDETPLTLATGWGWAVAEPVVERQPESVALAEFLSEGDFLAEWTEAAGYLPTRPSALAAWSNQSLKTLLSPVAVTAQARPSGDLLASLGPVLEEATLKVLRRESDPAQAAQAASERLTLPETK